MLTEDAGIVRECLSGESEAFGILVGKYKAGIYAYAKLGKFHDAQDVTQEVFLQAYRGLRNLRRWENFSFWLYRIAYNLCGKLIRAESRRPDRDFIEDQDPKMLEARSLDYYREEQVSESLQEALYSMPEAYREVLTLYYFGGMNSVDIARALGTSPAAIRKRLSRARAQLREEMIATMETAFEGHKLQGSFTFRIVEAVKHIKINPMPRMTALPWGLSLAAGIMVAVLSLSPHLDILTPVSPPAGSAPPSPATALKHGEITVDVIKISQMPFLSAMQGDGNSENSRQQSAFPMAPAAEGDTWATKGDMPTPRYMLGAVALNGNIYAIGGMANWIGLSMSRVEEYNPTTNTWTRKADMPTARSQLTTPVVNGKICAIGGLAGFDGVDKGDCLSAVEEYDPATDTWTKRAEMPELRYLLSSAVVNDRIYVTGGSSIAWPNYNLIPSVAEYTPPGWSSSVSPLSPQGKLPTTWGKTRLTSE